MACLVKEEGVVFYLESRFPPFVLCGKKIFEEERERERERDGEGEERQEKLLVGTGAARSDF